MTLFEKLAVSMPELITFFDDDQRKKVFDFCNTSNMFFAEVDIHNMRIHVDDDAILSITGITDDYEIKLGSDSCFWEVLEIADELQASRKGATMEITFYLYLNLDIDN